MYWPTLYDIASSPLGLYLCQYCQSFLWISLTNLRSWHCNLIERWSMVYGIFLLRKMSLNHWFFRWVFFRVFLARQQQIHKASLPTRLHRGLRRHYTSWQSVRKLKPPKQITLTGSLLKMYWVLVKLHPLSFRNDCIMPQILLVGVVRWEE